MNGGILFFADPHAGNTSHDVPTPDGRSLRQNELARVVEAVFSAAKEREATIVVPGDMYESRKPPAWAYATMQNLGNAIVIPGNHEWFEQAGKTSPLHVVGTRLITAPQVIPNVGGFDLIMLPWFGRSFVAAQGGTVAEQYRRMERALEELIASLLGKCSGERPIVLVCHASISGCSYNSETQPMLGESSEFLIPLNIIARPEFHAVVAGHIHKPQTITGGGCPVIYVGSAVRHDFGEEKQACRALYLAPDGTFEDVPLPAIEFLTFEIGDGVELLAPSVYDPQGKIVRLKGELPNGPESKALVRHWTEHMEGLALKVAKGAIRYTRVEASKEHALRVEMSPEEALTEYFALVGGEYAERSETLMETHRALVLAGAGDD